MLWLRFLALVPLLILSGACTRTIIREGTVPPVHVEGADTGVRFNNASITDPSLRGKVAIQNTGSSRSATGTAQVWVQIRNRTDYAMQLEARTQFYDSHKAPIGKPSGWQRVVLSPNTIQTYRENSVSTDVSHYFVEIREGR